jgi:thiol-disulfide isomerase/thioredoxin
MKAKTIVIAVALVAILTGAMILYNSLSDRAGPMELPVLAPPEKQNTIPETSSSGQQNTIPETSSSGQQDEPLNDREEITKAPDFTVQDAYGNDIKLSDMLGKSVVLNFWASWCPPCKGEMPDFNKVYSELGEDIQFMMVCVVDGNRETAETGAEHIEANGYTFPVYYDVNQDASMKYGITSIPTTYFIDAEGYFVTYASGAINEETLRVGINMIS